MEDKNFYGKLVFLTCMVGLVIYWLLCLSSRFEFSLIIPITFWLVMFFASAVAQIVDSKIFKR